MTCFNCGKEFGEIDGYRIIHLDKSWTFCGRLCLAESMLPEISRAIVPRQWIPTKEEEERMSE